MDTAIQSALSDSQNSSGDLLLVPIGEQGVGEDPRYGEDFVSVKVEISRLSDTDYEKIARLCQKILQNESKDLRVAGYYLMAKVFNDGIGGLCEAVELYIKLIKQYGNACHPQRDFAKVQAIAWLNNEKISAFIKKIDLSTDDELESVARLKSLIGILNEELTNLYDDDIARWTSLNPWVEKNLSSVPTKTEVEISEKIISKPETREDTRDITSELVFARSVERLLDYLANKNDLARLISVSRAIKWSVATLPKNEGGATKVTPPREAVILAAEKSTETGADESRLYELESYFMESGCQFYLDLQMQEIKIAKSVGRADIAEILESSLRQFVGHYPELTHLAFSDGKPFANDLTRRWLNKGETTKQSLISSSKAGNTTNLDCELAQAIDQMNGCDLVASIKKMSKIDVANQSEQFRLDLAKITICINSGRADMALPLAQKLEKQVERYRLVEWNKEMALAVWDKMLLIMQTMDKGTQSSQQKIDELKEKICATDLSFALGIF